jgi:putative ABC transport system permease protein
MGEVVEEANQGRRFYTLLITLFTVTALVLALVGIYGMMSFNVSQRIHEIGVRMALGARKNNVFGLFVRRGLISAGVGITIGLIATLWADQLIGHMVYGLSPLHPLVLVGGALFISVVTVAATAVPALRATRIELVHALRTE